MSTRKLTFSWSLAISTLCALALIVVLRKHQPSYEEKVAPISVQGRMGEPVQGRNFSVTARKLRLAQAYRIDGKNTDDPSRVVRADGIWLSVLVEAAALQQPGFISAQLRTRDGRTYTASESDRPALKGVNLSETQLLVGFPATGAFFFDVPPDVLEGATLLFHWGLNAPQSLDSLVEIDPGLDKATVAQLKEKAVPDLDMRTRTDR